MPRSGLPLDAVRWVEGSTADHVESYFLKANDPACPGRAIWLRFTLRVPRGGAPPIAEVWAIAFGAGGPRALRETVPFEQCTISRDGLGLEFGPNRLQMGRTVGEIGAGIDRIAWDLHFDHEGQEPMCLLAKPSMYEGGFPKSKVVTLCPDSRFAGKLALGSEVWKVMGWPGILGHNWGTANTPSYRWAQCNLLGEPKTVFEAISGRIPVPGGLSPWLTSAIFRHQGQDLLFNSVAGYLGNGVEAEGLRWSATRKQGGYRLKWTVETSADVIAGLRYENPDGSAVTCLNSKTASCRVELSRRKLFGWQTVAAVEGDRSSAFEIITQADDHGIAMLA